jgi:tRNA nucleotidyltransferase (CCA-adding enzyme)
MSTRKTSKAASSRETLLKAEIPEPVKSVVSRLQESGFKAFLVGGCVRDLLMRTQPKDYDIATSAQPKQVQPLFAKVLPTGVQHGTVTVLLNGMSVEVTTFRAEGEYLDGRHPSSVTFGTDIAEDLSRRDFTINAIAFDPISGELCDPFGGEADIAARRVRSVGQAEVRFSEDGLRALRAVRFATVLGFELDPQTAKAIPGSLSSFKKVSSERIREEFCKIMLSERVSAGIELLRTTDLLVAFLPEVLEGLGQLQDNRYAGDVYAHTLATVAASPADLSIRLAALLHDVAKKRTAVTRGGQQGFDFPAHEGVGASMSEEILERLKFPRATIEVVATLVRHHQEDWLGEWTEVRIRRFLAQVGEGAAERLLILAEANLRGRGLPVEPELDRVQQLRSQIEAVLADRPPLSPKDLALDGHAVMQLLGIGPSPRVGEATRFLLDRVLENPMLNSEAILTEELRKWSKLKGG